MYLYNRRPMAIFTIIFVWMHSFIKFKKKSLLVSSLEPSIETESIQDERDLEFVMLKSMQM